MNWSDHDPDWEDVIGFRGNADVESPLGEWTTVEIISDGGSIKNLVNGVVVNAVTDCTYTHGKVLLQSEGAELYIRKIELQPLK